MLGIYASAALIVLASLLVGRAVFAALGRSEWTWLEGAMGLAVLTVATQLTVRLPGRATTSLIFLSVLVVASLLYLWRRHTLNIDRDLLLAGLPVALLILAACAIPFILTGRTGVLGEGIYSNDQAIHLYWADWLQNGIGSQPRGLGLGYPVGPHSLVAVASTATGASIEAAFNGFMIAIPVLSALIALAALDTLRPLRRLAAAALVGLPYLAVAFLAQSSFKETTVALYVLAFGLALAALSKPGSARALLAALVLMPIAAVLTLSIPALAWFVLGALLWFLISLAVGELPLSVRTLGARLRRGWPLVAAVALAIALLIVIQYDALSRFIDRVDDVQASTGRLISREPPWQVLGVWPEGDFRLATSLVSGAIVAIVLGLVAGLAALPDWFRRREIAIPATFAAAIVVYAYTLAFGGIHVQAKSLAVAAPLVMLLIVRGLLGPASEKRARFESLRLALGAVFVVAAAGSTFLALRQAPVGTTPRAVELEQLRGEVAGADVVFLSLDRFAPYRLRGAESVQSPGGYVPEPIHARRAKRWVQGEQLDFDSVPSGLLDRYDYAITSATPYASSAPENFREVYRSDNYILWERTGEGPHRRILDNEGGRPGTPFHCARRTSPLERSDAIAGVIPRPLVRPDHAWGPSSAFVAPGEASLDFELPPGRWLLALQYHSEVDLSLSAGTLEVELPPALEGMYAFAPGRGPFWPLGEIESDGGSLDITVNAEEPSSLERLVRAQRRVWLGRIAAVPATGACRYRARPTAGARDPDRSCLRPLPRFSSAGPMSAPESPQLVFVGGTGRSGTHVVSGFSGPTRATRPSRSSAASTSTRADSPTCSRAG